MVSPGADDETRAPEASPRTREPTIPDERLEAIPSAPGVYLLKDAHGKVIYVGKAKSLRSRVLSYLRGGDGRHQIGFLVRRVADIECLVTQNEKEALILEGNLIKQYKPRYNIRLKDDKSYVSVKITAQDPWPRVFVTRRILKDGSRYFGPFDSASALRETLDVLRKVFPLRTCSDPVFRNRTRPCLEYQIKRCPGPCVLPVDRAAYEEHLRAVELLLDGRDKQLTTLLESRMHAAAEELRFEEAALLRDQLRALQRTGERQQIIAHHGGDQDVLGLYREGGSIDVQVLMVRGGKMMGHQGFSFADWELPDEEVVAAVITQLYEGARPIPDRILIPVALDDAEARAELLREKRGRAVELMVPMRGSGRRLVELASANARQAFLVRRDVQERLSRTASELQNRLHLRCAPKRIECIDISTFHGASTVGSIVAFDEGRPDTSRYRHYRVRTVVGTDDFASMREVLTRRLSKGKESGDLPDLLVIDGGRGQLGVALAVIKDLEINDLDVIGLAKMRVERDAQSAEVRRSEEQIFLPGRANPLILPRNSSALFLLQQMRDEAHRFAITHHQKLRARDRSGFATQVIPGVGPLLRRRLIRSFGSLAQLRAAPVEEIAKVEGVGQVRARRIRDALDSETST